MSTTLPETLPEDYSQKLALLEGILEKGISKLLDEARLKGFSKEPYGREPEPTPLMSEEDFSNSSAVDEPLGLNDDPSFDFVYGFNPMSYLAKYVRWSHPNSVRERKTEKERCAKRLHDRAKHAFKQLDTLLSLSETVTQQGSLVIWGPISTPLSSTSVIALFQPGCGGTYVFEASEHADFSKICQRKEVDVEDASNQEGNLESSTTFPGTIQVVIEELTPSTKYYIRVYNNVVNNDESGAISGAVDNGPQADDTAAAAAAAAAAVVGGNDGGTGLPSEGIQKDTSAGESNEGVALPPSDSDTGAVARSEVKQAKFYGQLCSFWTLPSDEEVLAEEMGGSPNQAPLTEKNNSSEHEETVENGQKSLCVPVRLNCVHAHFLPDVMPMVSADYESETEARVPELTCLLGDPVAAPSDATQIEQEEYTVDTWKFHTQNIALRSNVSLLRNSSLLLAWNDSRFGSDVDVRAEEVAFKRYSHDLKKHSKKYGKGGKKANSKAPPPPVLVRPQVSTSLLSLTTALPMEYTEEDCSARHIYKTTMLGPYVQLITLDLRSGYMSKEQAKWLKETLTTSSTMWKVVMSGLPIGVESFDSENDANDGGGSRPNSRHRSRIPSGTISLQGDHHHDDEGHGEEKDEGAKSSKASARVQVASDRVESEKEDCDEFGRPRTSLPCLISSIHRHFERKKSANTENETADDENSQGVESAIAEDAIDDRAPEKQSENDDAEHFTADTLTGAEDGENVIAGKSASATVDVESGIIFVSSNPGSGYGYAPFIAVYDPADTGSTYCAEVNIGGSADDSNNREGASKNATARGTVTEHLNSTFLQEEYLSQLPSIAQYQSQLQLNDDGTLTVRISVAKGVTPDKSFYGKEVANFKVSQTFRIA